MSSSAANMGPPHQGMADAMRKLKDQPNRKTCSVCSKLHATKDHPAPLSEGVCEYCFEGRCSTRPRRPCVKTETRCSCLCLTRGEG